MNLFKCFVVLANEGDVMFCSNCGEAQDNRLQFCTKCGSEIGPARLSKASRQAFVLFVLGLLTIPVWAFIGAAFPANDRLVESSPSTTVGESIAWTLMWLFFIAAAARITYAVVFEKASASAQRGADDQTVRPEQLPAGEPFEPASVKHGQWAHPSGELVDR